MREKGATAQEEVRLAAREVLEPLEELVVDLLGAELVDEVVVVDRHLSQREKARERKEGVRAVRRERRGRGHCCGASEVRKGTTRLLLTKEGKAACT